MKVAVLIHTHKDPKQVERLCKALNHRDIKLFINVDLKCEIAPFRELIPEAHFIENRIDIQWGQFSQVEATLNSLAYIKDYQARMGMKFGYVCFLSGQDYPLVSPERLLHNLEVSGPLEYIRSIQIDMRNDDSMARKVMCYHHYFRSKRVTKWVRRISYMFPVRRKYLYPELYNGASWWTLSGQCIDYIMRFCAENRSYVRFHKGVFCADEIFFQNIVMNSPFKNSATDNYHRYIDWSENGANPKTLTVVDFGMLITSDAWFARKFDPMIDAQILDMLDVHIKDA